MSSSWFFAGYVSGRGAIPADPHRRPALRDHRHHRILADELAGRPARRGLQALRRRTDRRWAFLQKLHAILGVLEASWRTRAGAVSRVGAGGDPHAALLDILGPASRTRPNSTPAAARAWTRCPPAPASAVLGRGPSERAKAAAQRQAGADAAAQLRLRRSRARHPRTSSSASDQIQLKGPLIEDAAALRDDLRWPSPPRTAATTCTGWRRRRRRLARCSAPPRRVHRRHAAECPPLHHAPFRAEPRLSGRRRPAARRIRPLCHRRHRGTAPRAEVGTSWPTTAQVSDSPWRRLYEPDQRSPAAPT